MLRVAFNARSLVSPVMRGWDRYTVGLAGALVQQGVEVTLLHREREPLCARHIEGLGCRLQGLRDLSGLHWEQVALPRALARGRFDLFHAPTENGVPLRAPCPVALTIHSLTVESYTELVRSGKLPGRVSDYLGRPPASPWRMGDRYLRAQFRRADHILTPSEFCRDEVIRFLHASPDRVTATPLAPGALFERPALSAAERAAALEKLGVRAPYLLYVGGYEPHKNVGGLLEAFALVRQARPELALVLVGTGSVPDALRSKAVAVGLAEGTSLVLLANLCDELVDLYDGAQLLVTMSWRETFCLPALEAMSRGVAVVASAWGAAPEVVGEAGRLVDPRSPAEARDAILSLLSDPKPAGLAARARAQARRFSWAETARRTLGVYERLVEHTHSSS